MTKDGPRPGAAGGDVSRPSPAPREHAGPGLDERLLAFLRKMHRSSERLEEDLEKLVAAHDPTLYSELIFLLSHLRFGPSEARRHWRGILNHRDVMQERMGAYVDLRVALASYFLQVQPRLENPKIIELRAFEEATASAYRDELTGLYNYRFFEECLRREILAAERCRLPLSLAMIDIDDFKGYNDAHGHPVGNTALQIIAECLCSSLRKLDASIRYGGEEFALVLPATTKVSAQRVAERLRQKVASCHFPSSGSKSFETLTLSMGVATYPADARSADELVHCADRALYTAKSAGRNRVELFGCSSRSYRRIRGALSGSFRIISQDAHAMTTLQLSEGGLLFSSDHEVPVGSLIDVSIRLPESEEEIAAAGRVVTVGPTAPGRYEAAVELTELASRSRGRLSRFVREQLEAGSGGEAAAAS
jgi:diguanylate cyclase (GGDEF)-like protein